MRSFCRSLLITALVLIGATPSYGAGFAMYEYSARGNALGGGLVGRADDASALAYNPAGITQLPGTEAMIGFTAINPQASVEVEGDKKYDAESKYWTPPHLYVTQQLNDNVWFGFGVGSRFGLGIEYEDDWAGRYNVYEAHIQSVSMTPTLALKLTDWLSIAAGPEIMWFEFSQKKKVDAFNQNNTALDIDAQLDGDSWGYGAVAGLHAAPSDWLRLGVTYRSQVTQTVEGDADFTRGANPGIPEANFNALFNDTTAEGKLVLPDSYTFGVVVYPTDKLSLELDAVYTRWSSYDELKIEFGAPLNPADPTSDQTKSEKDWNDVWRFQASAEYAVLNWLDLRASYVFDQTPVPDDHVDYMLPANDRHLYGAGLGFHVTENFDIDVAYTYLQIEERNVEGHGEGVIDSKFVDGCAHMYALSLAYRF